MDHRQILQTLKAPKELEPPSEMPRSTRERTDRLRLKKLKKLAKQERRTTFDCHDLTGFRARSALSSPRVTGNESDSDDGTIEIRTQPEATVPGVTSHARGKGQSMSHAPRRGDQSFSTAGINISEALGFLKTIENLRGAFKFSQWKRRMKDFFILFDLVMGFHYRCLCRWCGSSHGEDERQNHDFDKISLWKNPPKQD